MMPAPLIELEGQYVDKASFDRLGPMSRLAHELIDQLISFDFALNTAIPPVGTEPLQTRFVKGF